MITPDILFEIVRTYEKYGWQLRRIVLTGASAGLTDSIGRDLPGTPIGKGSIDAAWFSRPGSGKVAWEVRYLGPAAVAVLEHFDENDPDLEAHLSNAEGRLQALIERRKGA